MRFRTTAVGLALLASVASVSPASALAAAGEAAVVDATGNAIGRGATDTQFTLKVPKGAACQGDSKDGGYRVQSFLVPDRYDPGALAYNSVAPEGDGNWPLFDIFTNPYVQAQTGVAEHKGGAGPIVNTPLFSFAVFLPRLDLLASGAYHVGLACTRYNQTKRYWATDMRIVVRPGAAQKITWRVIRPAAAASRGSSALPMAGALIGLGLVGVAVAAVRRGRTGLRPAEVGS